MTKEDSSVKVAVVGTGIAGVSAAYYLSKTHQVTLYEKRERLGGHTHTIIVDDPNAGPIPVDTGFIVCNDRTYPNFHRFLKELEVPIRKADMSFGFYDENSDFGYAPTGIAGILPRWSHLLNASYLSLWRTLPRFNLVALKDLEHGNLQGLTLRQYVIERGISPEFVHMFLVPMGAAIWSSSDEKLLDTPAETFLGFFKNHGLLSIFDRPQWQTVVGGSHQYLKAFQQAFSGEIRLSEGVTGISRGEEQVVVTSDRGEEHYDAVVLACHADQVLPLLSDPSKEETELFSPWKYHMNRTVLHTDASYLPPDRKVWASWNYRREKGEEGSTPLSVTYHMNRLQGLVCRNNYCVTLNPRREIEEQFVIRDLPYTHPMYSTESVSTQPSIRELSGTRRTFYCGSYLGWGFHEDAIRSSVEVVSSFDQHLERRDPKSMRPPSHAPAI